MSKISSVHSVWIGFMAISCSFSQANTVDKTLHYPLSKNLAGQACYFLQLIYKIKSLSLPNLGKCCPILGSEFSVPAGF